MMYLLSCYWISFCPHVLVCAALYRPMEEAQSSPVMVEEIAVSFFSLLENILRLECLASTSMVVSHAHTHTQRLSMSYVYGTTQC